MFSMLVAAISPGVLMLHGMCCIYFWHRCPHLTFKRHPSSNEKDPQWLAITMDSIWNYLKWSSFDRVTWVLLWIPSWAYFLFVHTEVVAVHLWGHISHCRTAYCKEISPWPLCHWPSHMALPEKLLLGSLQLLADL